MKLKSISVLFNSSRLKWLIICTFILSTQFSFAQDSITTVIFVRHAEKGFDENGDPELTEIGFKRAELLAQILSSQVIDKIYSTPFKRTNQTVKPIADAKGLNVKEYNPFKIEDSIQEIKQSKGMTLLFSGHSNTIPILINKLLGGEELMIIDEEEYDNLFVLTLVNNQAKLIRLKFGASSITD